MTSTTDMAGHPDVAEISDLTEGLLPPSRTADVRRHLDGCELCADVYASLEEIRGLLGTVPVAQRMPDDVAERIDAALAAEALLDASAPDHTDIPATPVLVGASSSLSTQGDSDSAHVSRETSATADRPAGHARVRTTGPGRKDRKSAGRRRVAVLGSVFAVAALGLGGVLVATHNDGKPSDTEANGRSTAADTFSEGGLQKQVADLLGKNDRSGSSSGTNHSFGIAGDPSADTVSPKIFNVPDVPACIQRGIGRSDAALATKQGTYKGTPVLLVVLTDASDSAKVTAYVVDATCATKAPSTQAKVLLTKSYAQP
ncbi:anti-sigma factor family protein [Streptomyces sp. NPDC088794]|uniref:anti-sigma factor family protein n=1 Tax=Streptomyces sp. NPDC088794 TaxID=3365902 RepID=UPI0037FD69EC